MNSDTLTSDTLTTATETVDLGAVDYFRGIFVLNDLTQWITALVVFVVAFLLLRLVIGILGRILRKVTSRTKGEYDDLIARLVEKTRWWFYAVIALVIALQCINQPDEAPGTFGPHTIIILVFLVQSISWIGAAIDFWINRYHRQHFETDAASVTTMAALGFLAKLAAYVIIFMMILSTLTIPIAPLLASVGVAGIAIGLALQNVLSDLFASLSIVIDKPFVLGDFIIVGDYLGTVENIGLKTTRLRSLSGEQLVFNNSDLLSSRIRNYKRMQERRIVFSFGVIYQTTADQLEKIPGMVREIIQGADQTRFDRAHFKSYGDSSLDFEVVYYVLKLDYNIYMDVQQSINLALFRKFANEGIEFAYPTRTLYIEKTSDDSATD